MRFLFVISVIFLMICYSPVKSEDIIKIVALLDSTQKPTLSLVTKAIKEIEASEQLQKIKVNFDCIEFNREQIKEATDKLCSLFYEGISVLIDFIRFDWDQGQELIYWSKVLYLKIDFSIAPFLAALESLIQVKNGNDAVLIFQNDQDLEDGIHYIIDKSLLRVLPVNGFSDSSQKRIESLRPSPGYYAILADAANMVKMFENIASSTLLKRSDKWHFVFLEAVPNGYDYSIFPENVTIVKPSEKFICSIMTQEEECVSIVIPSLKEKIIAETLERLLLLYHMEKFPRRKIDCEDYSNQTESNELNTNLSSQLINIVTDSKLLNSDANLVSYHLNLSIYKIAASQVTPVAMWNDGSFETLMGSHVNPAKRFFRVGTVEAIPWSYMKKDPITQEKMLDDEGNPVWEGYCIDLIAKLAEKMSFDYEIVVPHRGKFGKRLVGGTWDGLVGDLVIGDTDIAVAALKMTAEREEVIDFVAPYFEQTGISIVIRKPLRQTSLFKFMTVLRLEVWLSIVAALVATAIMIWFLDKYSPYSARNDPKSYPYPCREFSLKESFWFALTSFTPQGGGEVPKSISARTLVAAYWLFVVLMLATFTANLAAFLTVERMQTPVQSLEQLARQSRINYTVVEGSDTHKYFINMKFAEDTLYRLWKELTLNATSDQSRYRIWDYPIKEQYGHILLAINSSNPVKDADEGFRQVSEHENADFAFIHDSAEIKYEISKNCNLTEIGEVFAEQPYAIAIQQGSHLQDELTYALLELQKDRYLEALTAKYWNNSAKKDCDNVDESEGITLESLGGVFIATLFGLGLAMLTLVFEVFYYKRKEDKITKVKPFQKKEGKSVMKRAIKKTSSVLPLPAYDELTKSKDKTGDVTITKDFIPASKMHKRITYINPRDPIHGRFYYD